MTNHSEQYDPQLQWVIDEVIHAITNRRCTETVWYDVYELIYDTTADYAWDEYQAQQRAEDAGEALYYAENPDG